MPANDPRRTIELPDDDPYLWLEEVEIARVLTWVEAQHTKILSHFDSDASFVVDRNALVMFFGQSDNTPAGRQDSRRRRAGLICAHG